MKNRSLILFLISATCLLPLISCVTPDPAEDLRKQAFKNQTIEQLNISAAKNTLVEGERTRLQALAMVGKEPQNVTGNTSFYVEGPGEIVRDNGSAYYVATSTTGDQESVVYATLDPSSLGSSGTTLESNQLDMFVLPREEYKVTMPSENSFETRK